MKEKVKKIITTTILTAMTATAVGCGTNGNKLAQKIDKGMAEFVTSVNKLDYVETGKPASDKVGKIVETSASAYGTTRYIEDKDNKIKFLNNNISEAEIENTITKPSDRNNDFKLYVLSDIPFISMTSDDSGARFSMTVKFSTENIEETSSEIDEKINTLILKRSILLIYVNEIYNGNVTLSEQDKTAINAYVNVIKENASFLNGNRGMVKNQLKLASDLIEKNSNDNLVNYYIIKSGEALKARASKFDSAISAIDSITKIIENNLTPNSTYYSTKLSDAYDSIVSNMSQAGNTVTINESSSNKEIADSISNSLDFFAPKSIQKTDENSNNQNVNNHNDEYGIQTLPLMPGEQITQTPNTNTVQQNDTNRLNRISSSNRNIPQTNTNSSTPNQSNTNSSENNRNLINSNNGFNNTNNPTNTHSRTSNRIIRRSPSNRNSSNNAANRINGQNSSSRLNTQNNQNLQNNATFDRNFNQNQSNLQNLEVRNTINNSENFVTQTDANKSASHSNRFRNNRGVIRGGTENMNQDEKNNNKTIRAERNPERVQQEEYTNASQSINHNRATRIPYRSNEN